MNRNLHNYTADEAQSLLLGQGGSIYIDASSSSVTFDASDPAGDGSIPAKNIICIHSLIDDGSVTLDESSDSSMAVFDGDYLAPDAKHETVIALDKDQSLYGIFNGELTFATGKFILYEG